MKMVEWSNIARKQGLLGLEPVLNRETDPFVRKALQLVVDGSEPESIRAIMEVELQTREDADTRAAKVFEGMGIYCPTLGIIGAVLGLMAVMQNLADPSKLGHGIAAAFTATVYGIGLANLFFLPVAAKLKGAIHSQTQVREMVIEGMLSIAQGENPRSIESKLQGYSPLRGRRAPVVTVHYMPRRKRHEEHLNHEAWAIPYGDLVTLLLAFFVVMYAISSINEGKYRVLSDSLFAAFRGAPRTMQPIQVGEKQVGSGADIKTTIVEQAMIDGQPRSMLAPVPVKTGMPQPSAATALDQRAPAARARKALQQVADQVARAMDDLVKANLVVVRRTDFWIEVEIKHRHPVPQRERAARADRGRRASRSSAKRWRRIRIRSASKVTRTTGRSRRSRSFRTGSCPPHVRAASCACWRARAWRRAGSR